MRKTFRRQGIAKRLCREAEAVARSWGYSEVLLRVEKDNAGARKLYRALGYRAVAEDREAERPEASSGRLQFVPTTQTIMRKDLRFPPLDTLLGPLAVAGAACGLYPAVAPVAADIGTEFGAGRPEQAVALLLTAVSSTLASR